MSKVSVLNLIEHLLISNEKSISDVKRVLIKQCVWKESISTEIINFEVEYTNKKNNRFLKQLKQSFVRFENDSKCVIILDLKNGDFIHNGKNDIRLIEKDYIDHLLFTSTTQFGQQYIDVDKIDSIEIKYDGLTMSFSSFNDMLNNSKLDDLRFFELEGFDLEDEIVTMNVIVDNIKYCRIPCSTKNDYWK